MGAAHLRRLRNALPPHFVLAGSTLVRVATHVIGLGSITVQCRQRVNTPCWKPLRTEALMDVWKTFLVPFGVYQKELVCRDETRPGGSEPHSHLICRVS